MAELVYTRPYTYTPMYYIGRAINVVLGIIELLLALRIVLELLAANSGSAFVAWVYSVSGSLVGPFFGAFPNIALGAGGSFIDLAAILAMIAYSILAWLLIMLLSFIVAPVE